MKSFFYSLALFACLFCCPALAQQAPVQSINLSSQESLSGLVQLANGNTILFLANSETPDVRVHALRPDGQTAWQANLLRFQHMEYSGWVVSIRNATLNKLKKSESTILGPMDVCSSGDNVYAIEVLNKKTAKSVDKNGTFKPGQIMIQHLDGAGKVSKASFAPLPEIKFTDSFHLGWFGEGQTVYRIMADYNDREGSVKHFLEQYDIVSRTHKRLPVELPAMPERTKMNVYYNDWGYLGHRPNQTYFFRRLRGHSKKDRFNKMPIEYQVAVVDNSGASVGGFTTILDLEAGTETAYSSYHMQQLQEQQHVPRFQERGKEIVDEYRASTGGIGNFYLDYATGDVIIYGEFSREETWGDLAGLYMRRYTSAGKIVQQTQFAYSKDMIKKNEKSFNGLALFYAMRTFTFSHNPLSHDYEFTFEKTGMISKSAGWFRVTLKSDMQFQHYSFQEKEPKLLITFVKPSYLYKCEEETRFLDDSINKQDATLHTQLLSLAKRLKQGGYQYFLSPNKTGGALLVERQALQGSKVNIYPLQ